MERFYILLPPDGHHPAMVLDEAVSLDVADGSFHPGAVVIRSDEARTDPRWTAAIQEWERARPEAAPPAAGEPAG